MAISWGACRNIAHQKFREQPQNGGSALGLVGEMTSTA
jgi:hypothetical protein